MDRWVSVKDELPLKGSFLCSYTDEDGDCCIFIGYFNGDEFYEPNNGDYIDGGYGGDYERPTVTHWQSLPSPPEL